MPLDLLVFGPHPDDLEIGLAGTIARHVAEGYAVGLCDLTAGELGSNGTPDERRQEAAEAARVLGVAWRENLGWPDGSITPERVVDVQFEAFMADHFGTIASIYDAWGTEYTDEARARMQAFLDDHGREKHGVHRYSFADTGLDEGEIRERARRYTDYFDVPVERVRST